MTVAHPKRHSLVLVMMMIPDRQAVVLSCAGADA